MKRFLCTVVVAIVSAGSAAAQTGTVVKKKQPERGYAFRLIRYGQNVWSDRNYSVSLLPPALKGAYMIVRPTGTQKDWPDSGDYTVTEDCTAFIVVRSDYNGEKEFPQERVDALIAAEWEEIDESFRVAEPGGESWKWRIFKKDIPAGKLELQPGELQLGTPTVFMFARKPKPKK